MTHKRQTKIHLIDAQSKQRISYDDQYADSNPPKRYLTNSDKSIYNLRWQTGGMAQKNYIRSRSPPTQPETPKISPRDFLRRRRNYINLIDPNTSSSTWPTSQQTSRTTSGTNHNLDDYLQKPARKHHVKQPSVRFNMIENGRLESVKPIREPVSEFTDSPREGGKVKIEHHFVDSPREAQRVIDDLRRKGFIETGIEIPVSSSRK